MQTYHKCYLVAQWNDYGLFASLTPLVFESYINPLASVPVTVSKEADSWIAHEWKAHTHYFDTKDWWFNGHLLCNTRAAWSSRDVETLSLMFSTVRMQGPARVLVNRRDFPWVKTDGTLPYTFLRGPLPQVFCSLKELPLSFYGGRMWRDMLIPPPDHWSVWKDTESLRRQPFATRKRTAVFRGTLTGKHMDDRNVRIALCKVRHTLLDAGLTAWTRRERISLKDGNLQVIAPPPSMPLVPSLTREEQAHYQVLIYAHGHVASSRLAWQLCSGSLVIALDSPCDAPEMWFSDKIPKWRFRVGETPPHDACFLETTLGSLIPCLEWCLANSEVTHQIVQTCLSTSSKVFHTERLRQALQHACTAAA